MVILTQDQKMVHWEVLKDNVQTIEDSSGHSVTETRDGTV